MANWQKVTLTDKGAALLAKITARNLAFPLTRIAFGSGRPSNLNTATALAAQIDNAEIISKIQKDNTCTITFRFNNTKFTKAYDICEFGIFATDPDDGEILFAVSTDSNPDHIQAASTSSVVTKTIVASGTTIQATLLLRSRMCRGSLQKKRTTSRKTASMDSRLYSIKLSILFRQWPTAARSLKR